MYEKLTFKRFKELLSGNRYDAPKAARRAVGRATLISDSEKEQCDKLINNFFGVEPVKKPNKGKPGRPPKAATTAVKTAKAVAKADKDTKPKPSKSGRKPGRPRKVTQDTTGTSVNEFTKMSAGRSLSDVSDLSNQMRIAETVIHNTSNALSNLLEAKKISPELELDDYVQAASRVLSEAVNIFRGVTHKVTAHMLSEVGEAMEEVESSVAGNNGMGATYDFSTA